MADLRGLWLFAFRKREYKSIAIEVVLRGDQSESKISDKDIECQPFLKTGNHSLLSAKRKEPELLDKDEGGEISKPLLLKKKKFIWTVDMRKRFVESIGQLVTNSHPKKMLQHMNVPGLTKENISGHLQTKSLQGRCLPFLEQQCVTRQPDFSRNCQKDLSSFTSIHFLGPAHFPSQEISSCQVSNSRQNQLILPCNLQGVVPITPGLGELKINGNEEAFAGSSQVGNATSEEIFNGSPFVYVDYTSVENETHLSTMLANDMLQQFPQEPLLPVPPLPLEAEGTNIGELLDFPNGAQQFTYEDLNLWLSSL